MVRICTYLYACMHYTNICVGISVLVREMGMGVHAAAPPPMRTCVRLRAPTLRPSPSRAHARVVRPPAYIADAHVMYNIHVCIHQRKVRVYKWVRVCVLAYVCDRVRALTMREYAACVRVRRAHFVRPSIDGTRAGIVCRYMMHACVSISMRV
jgi:hypothetical protein